MEGKPNAIMKGNSGIREAICPYNSLPCLYHGDEPYRILVVQNRILFVISGLYLCKRVYVGRGKYPENHM